MRDLPSGTVTFLFSDIEGSTRLLDELGAERYAEALAEHRRVMRAAFAAHGGFEVDTQGDAFFAAFPEARDALAAATQVQKALAAGSINVRMGIHSGEPLVTEEGYVGIDVHRGARVMAAGHGGQVLVSEATYALLDGDSGLTELGRHRLRDLTEPQPLWQLGEGVFPPLKTLYQTNLPVQPTPLVGREVELAEVLELLERTRLLTLTGAGGSGKTRLALQAAAELVDEYKDGVWWVSLSALRDPALVEPTIAQAVGAKDGLADHLRDKQTLFLLDNFEQVIDAAPAIAALLSEAPDLRVLVTSRAPLRLAGEHEYPVEPLPDDDAVTLFLERARAAGRRLESDATVAAICRRLDGLPLAIELAAARTKLLAPETLLERLERALPLLSSGRRDAPARQQTLRATIEWSYDLLDEGAKRLFAHLSVFAGSFSLEAAEAVCAAQLDSLAALVDLGLLKPLGASRFLMLETIRELASERLVDSGEANELARIHAMHFMEFVAERRSSTRHGDPSALEALELEQDNSRRALEWSLASRSHEIALSLLQSLWIFWLTKGYGPEGHEWSRRIVAATAEVNREARLHAWHGASEVARFVGDFDWAEALKAEVIETARATGNDKVRAFTLTDLAQMAADRGDLPKARALAEEALAIRREIGEEFGIAHTRCAVAYIEFLLGNFVRAREIYEGTTETFERASSRLELMNSWLMIGECLRREGDHTGARRHLRDALEEAVAEGHAKAYPELLQEIAALAQAGGNSECAAKLLGASDRFYDDVRSPIWAEEDRTRTISAARATLGDRQFEAARTRGADLDTSEAIDLARAALD